MVENAKWGDIAYHYVIGPSGRICQRRNERFQGDSHTDFNPDGKLLICLMGNFDLQKPSPEALQSLTRLAALKANQYRVKKEAVVTHGDLADTKCPGKNLKAWLREGGGKTISSQIVN